MNEFTLYRFRNDWIALGGNPDSGCVRHLYDALETGYTEPWRRFHDRNHILNLLAQLDDVASHVGDLATVRMAVWFHDVVCVPGATGNEQASADLWRRLATDHLAPCAVDRVAELVLDTRHLVAPGSADGAVLADIDIAGLGADASVFDHQSLQVSAEFPNARQAECEAAQKAFLAKLLEREWIYHTTYFRDACERGARANLSRFLAA
ncbi:MAG: hypothetical protein AAGA11_02565 [Pseudomonadota bacterium]